MDSEQATTVLLRSARIVLPDRVLEKGDLLIEAGRIAQVISDGGATPVARVTHELTGLTLYPGMIDIHIHGAVGIDTMTASKDDLVSVSGFLAANGVTAWVPTLVPAPHSDYQTAVTAIEAAMTEEANEARAHRARILGVHYEGPFVNAAQCGALHASHFKSFSSEADIAALPTPNVPGAVRLMTLAPEVEGGIDLTRELVSRGWVVSLGHTRADLERLEQAFAAGAHHLTHFMNAMPPLHHRAPGPVGWGLSRAEVTFDLIADGIHLDPFVLRLLLQAKGAKRMMLISDAIAAAGKGDGDYEIWGETISVQDGRTSNASGSIAGSVITMLNALRMIRSLNASEVEAARMASTNPAKLLGLDQLGSIEVGKYADLVALDQQGEVKFIMIEGQVVDARC